ncbi:hypothetical protein ABZU92_14320 [Micromonospora arida]|uniref:hypothetical protein n=1 Tax=Micromonospora arida TaxID=2203715 RepID=UPI0013155167|nr:hypothetical protein [Micromonospora arida]
MSSRALAVEAALSAVSTVARDLVFSGFTPVAWAGAVLRAEATSAGGDDGGGLLAEMGELIFELSSGRVRVVAARSTTRTSLGFGRMGADIS